MITAVRLCNRAFAPLDGRGAKLYGGRWNPKGLSVIYSSSCLSLATLEALVHLNCRPDSHVYIKIQFDEGLVSAVEDSWTLPSSWIRDSAATQELGEQWISAAKSAVLSVPSAVVSINRNYLINPNHPDFSGIRIFDSVDHGFDYRLLSHHE